MTTVEHKRDCERLVNYEDPIAECTCGSDAENRSRATAEDDVVRLRCMRAKAEADLAIAEAQVVALRRTLVDQAAEYRWALDLGRFPVSTWLASIEAVLAETAPKETP